MWTAISKAWFDLTLDERRALILVLTVFLIGLLAISLRNRRETPNPVIPPTQSAVHSHSRSE